ncbi:MAG: hypothetical protein IJR45_02180, partial [Firmicutes bacterium]|nr:hypothetical protein [Bacillota bacterium]
DFKGTVNISGGTVIAKSADTSTPGGAGIGAGAIGNMTGTINISGGNVTAHGYGGGAGIGAGRESPGWSGTGGECEGTIHITGGDITAETFADQNGLKGRAIGHGADGDDNGTIRIDGKLSLTQGENNIPVEYTQRGKSATTIDKVHITSCEHLASGLTYTINHDNSHTWFCSYCGHSETADHNTNGNDGACVCGYGDSNHPFTVKFMHINEEIISSEEVAVRQKVLMPALPAAIYNNDGSYIQYAAWINKDDAFRLNTNNASQYYIFPGEKEIVNKDLTFIAVAEKVYKVDIDSQSEHGKIKTDTEYAKEGDTVLVTPIPDNGYIVGAVYVNDTKIELSKGGQYVFAMPQSAAVISAEFTEAPSCSAIFTSPDGTSEPITYKVYIDDIYTLPDCTFAVPEGKVFKCWQSGGRMYNAGDEITFTDDTTFTAVYVQPYTDYDAARLLKHISEVIIIDANELERLDMNNDNVYDMRDVIAILNAKEEN